LADEHVEKCDVYIGRPGSGAAVIWIARSPCVPSSMRILPSPFGAASTNINLPEMVRAQKQLASQFLQRTVLNDVFVCMG
jgi:hypothetical protein